MAEISPESLLAIVAAVRRSSVRELDLQLGETWLHIVTARSDPAAAASGAGVSPDESSAGPAASPGDARPTLDVRAPSVGLLRLTASPDLPPVAAGRDVTIGEHLSSVDVLGRLVPIVAPSGGTVSEICAEDGSLVEYGEVVLRIVPT